MKAKQRHFLVAYTFSDGTSKYGTGNITFSMDGFPSKKFIRENSNVEKQYTIVVTNIIEFKTESDLKSFQQN